MSMTTEEVAALPDAISPVFRWTKVAGDWVVRVPDAANVRPGDTVTVFSARSGVTKDVEIVRLGPPFMSMGETWRNAHPAKRAARSKTSRYQSTGTNRTWKQTYGRCEDAPCCGCCS